MCDACPVGLLCIGTFSEEEVKHCDKAIRAAIARCLYQLGRRAGMITTLAPTAGPASPHLCEAGVPLSQLHRESVLWLPCGSAAGADLASEHVSRAHSAVSI